MQYRTFSPAEWRELRLTWLRVHGGRLLAWPTTNDWSELLPCDWTTPANRVDASVVRPVLIELVQNPVPYREEVRAVQLAIRGTNISVSLREWLDMEFVAASDYASLQIARLRAADVGELNPRLYRRVHSPCCARCAEFYGPRSKPKLFRYSELSDCGDVVLGNLGKLPEDWTAVAGPTHPGCNCGPITWFDDPLDQAVTETVSRLGR